MLFFDMTTMTVNGHKVEYTNIPQGLWYQQLLQDALYSKKNIKDVYINFPSNDR